MKFGIGSFSTRWGLLRGESAVASIGLAAVLILVGTLAACGAWFVRSHSQAAERARLDQLATVADLLAVTVEPGLVDDAAATRRVLAEATARYTLDWVRVTDSAGRLMIDSLATEPMEAMLEGATFAAQPPEPGVTIAEGAAVVTRPVLVAGHGWAELSVSAPLASGARPTWESQAGVGTIGAVSLLALLVVYRYHRTKMLGVGAVREALLEMHRGETSESALQLAGGLGIEAEQWNTMLAEQQRLRRLAAVQQTRQSLGTLTNDQDELTSGCDAMPQGLVMVDDELRVRYANHAAVMFLRKSREEMSSHPLDAMLPIPELQKALRDAVVSGRRATHLLDRRKDSGGVLRFIIRPVRRADASSAMVVIEDVTQQRVAEEARHDFVAHATHELRAPLTNIRLYIETLLDEDGVDDATRSQSLNVINTETRRLERMVGDMLSVAEIEAGSLRLSRDDVDLLTILRETERDFAPQAGEKRIDLAVSLPPKLSTIYADRDKLVMAIQNLVGNAIKYTPAGGRVDVTVEQTKEGIGIDVRDTGLGIDPKEHEKVFEKFYRANDKRVTGITGSGLGLALSREVIRLHGGDITLDSRIDQGSTFSIRLPLTEAK